MRNLIATVLAAGIVPAALAAQPRSDTDLTAEVTAAVEEASLAVGILEVEVRDGVAILIGEVLDDQTRERLVGVALGVEGIVAVETELTVLQSDPDPPDPPGQPDAEGEGIPLPTRPDDLVRREVVEALERVDLDAGAPMVAVRDGVVRLTGQVANAWERGEVMEKAGEVAGVVAVDPELEVARPESVEELVKDVRSAVLRYTQYTVFDDVNFGVEDDFTVRLVGAVTDPFKKTELGVRVARVFGVRSVDNRIEVLPLSPNDQDIRYLLYRRIYRDSRFSDRAHRVNPPIHIIVSRGRVVLTGHVRSAVESRVLESIARSTPGVFNVENRLRH